MPSLHVARRGRGRAGMGEDVMTVAETPPKVGLVLPVYEGMLGGQTARWADLLDMARQAEAAGFDSVWLFDHLLIPVDRYVPGAAPMGAWECWSLLAALAAATERVTLGTL